MASAPDKPGTLYLMPTWLGEHGTADAMPAVNAELAARITLWFCEHEKSARAALRRLVPAIDLPGLELHRLDKDSTPAEAEALIGLLRNGRDGAIISEAGMPGIADPGALLVQAAHRAGIAVQPLVGPSALLLALAASGLSGQRFAFHGYLPVKPAERRAAIKRLETEALRTGAAQLFIETPYRNDGLLADLLKECAPSTVLCIGIDLTQPGGTVQSRSIADWKRGIPTLGKRPAVFILGPWAR